MELAELDDETLIQRLKSLARDGRENVADTVAHLAEMDRRHLALDLAYPSLFVYCVRELGYSEAAAYHRIRAARAARICPRVIEMLRGGELHLEAVVLLHPHLKDARANELLDQAKGKSKREVETMVSALAPEVAAPDSIRILSYRKAGSSQEPMEPDTLFVGLGADEIPGTQADQESSTEAFAPTVRFRFSADLELLAMVERARELLRHKYPDGRLEGIFKDALNALLARRDPDRRLLAKLPRASAVPRSSTDQVT